MNRLHNIKKSLFESIKVEEILPTLGKARRKGQNGRLGVIGGSIEFTGAPYFSSMAQLCGVNILINQGGDLSYIITTPEASTPIKCYSPDLIVYPYLVQA